MSRGRGARAGPGDGLGPGPGLGARLGPGGGPASGLPPSGRLLLWGPADGPGAAPGAVAAPGSTPGAGVAARARAALTVTPAVLKDLQFASVQLCPIELGDGVLHVTARCKLNHPFIFVGSVSVHKGNFTCFSHQVFQVLC